jgi:alginate O-acetyltransferase complex protein AlgI
MLFNSVDFFIFFPVVAWLAYAVPRSWRWLLLLVASGVFYAWFVPAYLAILGGMILLDYCTGLLIARSTSRWRRLWLLASLTGNLGLLAVFKYWNFAVANSAVIGGWLGIAVDSPTLRLILPIGLSFHTFQAMSYTIEVYRGRFAPERHLGYFALYVMFFPQLVAGPIERPQNLLPQLRANPPLDYGRVVEGLRLMLGGLLMKMLIADGLAIPVDRVYAQPTEFTGPALALATTLFAFQIYCDFAGYSFIALGAARVLGVNLTPNFRNPFLATSISNYWQRWHISLTSWFRDYVYEPLTKGGLSMGRARLAIVFVFLLSGLWHGASWTFVAWGGLHGFYLVLGNLTWRIRRRLLGALGLHERHWMLVFSRPLAVFGLVCLSFVFFRANSVADASYIFKHLFTGWDSLEAIRHQLALAGTSASFLTFALVEVAGLLVFAVLNERGQITAEFAINPWWLRWGAYYCAFALIAGWGSENRPFVYFQF